MATIPAYVQAQFTGTERMALLAIRWLHEDEIKARHAGWHLAEYRRLVFWRKMWIDASFAGLPL